MLFESMQGKMQFALSLQMSWHAPKVEAATPTDTESIHCHHLSQDLEIVRGTASQRLTRAGSRTHPNADYGQLGTNSQSPLSACGASP
jgi:hypothetical protein